MSTFITSGAFRCEFIRYQDGKTSKMTLEKLLLQLNNMWRGRTISWHFGVHISAGRKTFYKHKRFKTLFSLLRGGSSSQGQSMWCSEKVLKQNIRISTAAPNDVSHPLKASVLMLNGDITIRKTSNNEHSLLGSVARGKLIL